MLNDPQNLVSQSDFDRLNEKISAAKSIMARSVDHGGMPFVYSFIATKKHYLDDFTKIGRGKKSQSEDGKTDGAGLEKVEGTAATNGKKYFWYPAFLEKLSINELKIIFCHETYHIMMQHCNPLRSFGKNHGIWNLAVDYVVNASIEHDFRCNNGDKNNFTANCEAAYKNKTEHPIWNGNLHKPYVLADLIADILSYKGLSEEEKNKKLEAEKKNNNKCTFVDFTLYKRSPESIYEEIMNAYKSSGLSAGDLNDLMDSYLTNDSHLDSDLDKKAIFEELLSAATASRKMYGTIPGCLEDTLNELENPKLKWEDICRQSLQYTRQEFGGRNDWCRFRRKSISLGLYIPKKKDQFIRWLCLLDTSGSMSLDDMTYGVSQLKVLDSRSEGIVVPVDAEPHWNKMVKIKSMFDLPKINLAGRGGTVFDEFFDTYQKRIKERIDLIIVVTDGGFHLNCKTPPVDTVFVITNEHMPEVPFGRVAPLRSINT